MIHRPCNKGLLNFWYGILQMKMFSLLFANRRRAVIHIIVCAFVLGKFAVRSGCARKTFGIRLAEIDGRTWLITPDGKPFFAHGITHTTNRSLSSNYNAVSKACKDIGFNAYGYGCPPQLKKDMPYVEGRNYVPISTYRGKGGVSASSTSLKSARATEADRRRSNKPVSRIGKTQT